MNLGKELTERIYTAADTLFAQNGGAGFPTVDAVRKAARVNMNDASTAMKAWRRARMLEAQPAVTTVPESLRQTFNTSLAALWREAQTVADGALRTAQSAWEAERSEADALMKQMADAYELQATELATTQLETERARADTERFSQEVMTLTRMLQASRDETATANAAAERADIRTVEIERRAGELRAELDVAHAAVAQHRTDLAATLQAHAETVRGLRDELAASRIKVENDRTTSDKVLGDARQKIAGLRGQLAAVNERNEALLVVLAAPRDGKSSTPPDVQPAAGGN